MILEEILNDLQIRVFLSLICNNCLYEPNFIKLFPDGELDVVEFKRLYNQDERGIMENEFESIQPFKKIFPRGIPKISVNDQLGLKPIYLKYLGVDETYHDKFLISVNDIRNYIIKIYEDYKTFICCGGIEDVHVDDVETHKFRIDYA